MDAMIGCREGEGCMCSICGSFQHELQIPGTNIHVCMHCFYWQMLLE